MKSTETMFYASADKPVLAPGEKATGFLLRANRKYQAAASATSIPSETGGQPFLLVKTRLPEKLAWNDRVPFKPADKEEVELRVLYPEAQRLKKIKEARLVAFLERLAGSEKEMLLALTEEAGIRGLREEELLRFCRLSPERLRALAMELEKEGLLYILEFSPLFLLAQRSFTFLLDKICEFVESYHQKRPAEPGVPVKKLKERFGLSKSVLRLALNRLARDGKLTLHHDLVCSRDFEIRLMPEESAILQAIEQLLHEEKFSSSSYEELLKKFRIHPSRLNTLLDMLLRQKKIVKSQEGFLLHAEWLEELKQKLADLKRQGQKELTVGDFKKLTGLTRKYAIPLLEFLDELGLTSRVGNKRIIL